MAYEVGQIACVDAHGAGQGAEPVACAGLVAQVVVLLFQQGKALGIVAFLAQAGQLALDDDALAR